VGRHSCAGGPKGIETFGDAGDDSMPLAVGGVGPYAARVGLAEAPRSIWPSQADAGVYAGGRGANRTQTGEAGTRCRSDSMSRELAGRVADASEERRVEPSRAAEAEQPALTMACNSVS
jgi:hypothetical protein